MALKVLCCEILRGEMEYIMRDENVELHYLDPALHVNLDRLEEEVVSALDNAGPGLPLVIGTRCHPEMERLAREHGGKMTPAGNCIEMLLGGSMAELDNESNNFYITPGWLENWEHIFKEGLMWSEIDARQNFGFYDRVIMLDTGITPVDEEKIIEFFDYTQVPVEIVEVSLDNLRGLVKNLLEEG